MVNEKKVIARMCDAVKNDKNVFLTIFMGPGIRYNVSNPEFLEDGFAIFDDENNRIISLNCYQDIEVLPNKKRFGADGIIS